MNTKEIAHIIIAIIVFAFVISFLQGLEAFLFGLIIAAVILTINIVAKEVMARYLDTKLEHKIWHFQRWGLYERSYLKKPIPIGIFIPFLMTILSWGYVSMLTLLQTNITPALHRAAKRRGGPSRFSEITEWHTGAIPAFGIALNLIVALIIYIFLKDFSLATNIAKFSVYYSAWNLIPLGQLDGTKILFGSKLLWFFLFIVSAIFTLIVLFLL